MQFSCMASELNAALQTVTKALAGRTTNQILEGVCVEAEGNQLSLTCSDERITIVTHLPAMIEEPGRGVAPGKLFMEMVRRMPEGRVDIRMDERFVFNIRSGSAKLNLSGQNAELFPELPRVEDACEFVLPQDTLRDMIQKTLFAVAQDDAREILTGCLLEIEKGDVNMVGLDGYRMALRHARCSIAPEKFTAIIPGRAAGEIGQILSDNEEAFAKLSFSGNKLHIKLDNTEIYVILIEGEYIQYRQLLPRSFATKVEVGLECFRKSIDRAALIAREGTNKLVVLTVQDGKLLVEAHSPTGDVHEELEASKEGDDLSIAFNVKYLMDVVRWLESDTIELDMNSAISPCVITPMNNHDYVHLVLPVRMSAASQG